MISADALRPASCRGFTLIELMIAVAIVAILAGIALPAYNSYILKGKIRAAQADLVALSLNLENRFQRQLSYSTDVTASTSETEALFAGWRPAQGNDFTYSLNNNDGYTASNTKYLLKATGSSSSLTQCVLILESNNSRSISGCTGVSSW